MCFNATHRKIHIDNICFVSENRLIEQDALPLLIFKYALKCTFKKAQETQAILKKWDTVASNLYSWIAYINTRGTR
jgi:hypothetical protein